MSSVHENDKKLSSSPHDGSVLPLQEIKSFVYHLPPLLINCIFFSGILLYEMLYGYTPFRGKTRQKTFANILHKDLKFPGSISVRFTVCVYRYTYLYEMCIFLHL